MKFGNLVIAGLVTGSIVIGLATQDTARRRNSLFSLRVTGVDGTRAFSRSASSRSAAKLSLPPSQ